MSEGAFGLIHPGPLARDVFADTWARLCASGETPRPSPGHREVWHRGRPRYAVWLTRICDEAVLERMRELAVAFGSLARPQPVSEAHITVWVAGFPVLEPAEDDDVAWSRLREQAAAVAQTGRLRLQVGGANSFLSCAFLEVFDPGGDLDRLRGRLGEGEIRFAHYQPHITAAFFDGGRPVAPIRAALGPLRERPLLALEIDRIELVTFQVDEPFQPLETAVSLSL